MFSVAGGILILHGEVLEHLCHARKVPTMSADEIKMNDEKIENGFGDVVDSEQAAHLERKVLWKMDSRYHFPIS